MSDPDDPTEALRRAAAAHAGVDEGSACTQSSFKVGKKAFLFAGPQGGRFKAMFKLKASLPEATRLAGDEPDRFEVGKDWVTARFTAERPMPRTLWKRWLAESYELAAGPPAGKPSATERRRKA